MPSWLLFATDLASIVFVRRSLLELGFFEIEVEVLLKREDSAGETGGVLEDPNSSGVSPVRGLGSTAAGMESSGMNIWLVCVTFRGVGTLFYSRS